MAAILSAAEVNDIRPYAPDLCASHEALRAERDATTAALRWALQALGDGPSFMADWTAWEQAWAVLRATEAACGAPTALRGAGAPDGARPPGAAC